MVIAQILSVDRKIGRIILAGIAVFAAAAIVVGFSIDMESALAVGGYVLAFGVALTILSRIAETLLSTVVGWLAATLFFLWSAAVLTAAALPTLSPPLAPPPCIIQFWKTCDLLQDKIAANKADALSLQAVVEASVQTTAQTEIEVLPDANKIDVGSHKVFIHFAGVIRREDIVSLASGLRSAGWAVNGRDGERLSVAQGLNEVRYSLESNKPFAEALARTITETGITSRAVETKQLGIIRPDTLEVWISRS